MKQLPVLYKDDHLVVVNKPSGLLVHRSAIDRHETEHAMRTVRDQLGQWVYPVHRLDKATSGVLVFALDPDTARRMTDHFTGEAVAKTYLAVVRGYAAESGRIDHPLKERWDKMTGQLAGRNKPEQSAVTDFERLAIVELPHPVGRYASARFSLVRAMPRTGRNHQIRRHLKHIFHPVINDTRYGDGAQNAFFRTTLRCRRMLLHASEIAFPHPHGTARVRVRAPLDDAFLAVLNELQWGGTSLM